ncbi:sodium:solute symporter [Elizabethkingia ursingii]|jgi:SSS family transporter|uniref:sodium:solute symporter n=1 Tax=Elizabethkingia ursingii TaxID=1756150 RepID=UPI0009998C1A|nr:sodium:solute symporter [Elizabethkingia ursingii]MCL1663348.1 sodium:solute symporter [Elizabethkingia ursingii]MDR2228758.1 sodium:solute symporter [Flavobacteriaceae bacterium]OPC06357.1 sodium:solute symporter [Elizabethkingia ursingii]
MSPVILLLIVFAYFAILLYVSYRTGKGSNNESFFIGNRNSNWMLVAFGMIGTSLSGVTFVSVPGAVGKDNFGYLQITLGYLIGYIIIAYVLLPLYYRLKLTSIYSYLQQRMGKLSEKTGATIFIISRLVGATARLYLVVNILQMTILDKLGVPFIATTIIILGMIILYTYEGGVKTIVWTDTLQTSCMLGGLIICTIYMLSHMGISVGESLTAMHEKGYTQIFGTDPMEKNFFIKQIIAGAFITITMTGIDQEMMQKSLSVTNLKDSQKNMVSLGFIMLVVIGLFLYMGGLLHLYGAREHVAAVGDGLFPAIALEHMSPVISVIFIIALISALFPSADGAMTALTSSFCIDILNIKNKGWEEKKQEKVRKRVHIIVAISFLIMVLVFKWINDSSMIGIILKLAGFTYGPLLGLFVFGIFTKYKVKDHLVPYICIAAPVISYFIDKYQEQIFGEFKIGLELLLINGLLTFIGLFLIRKK